MYLLLHKCSCLANLMEYIYNDVTFETIVVTNLFLNGSGRAAKIG